MPIRTLAINELVMMLALDDDNGKIRWSVSPYLEYALAGGMLAELALAGRIHLAENGHLERSDDSTAPTGSGLLDDVLARFAEREQPDSVSGWVAAISTMPGIDHRQMDELAAKGVLEKREGHFLFLFHTTVYPTLDRTPEKVIIAQIREAVLGKGPVDRRLAVLITIAHGAHLLRGPLTDDELDQAEPRLLEIQQGEVIAEATLDLIQQAERALYIASSIPFMGVSRL